MRLKGVVVALPAVLIPILGCGGANPTAYEPMAIEIQPRMAELTVDDPLPLTFKGRGYEKVEWSVVEPGGGSIGPDGVYTAPSHEGVYHVQARAVENPDAKDRVELHVHAAPVATSLKADLTRTRPGGTVMLTADFAGGKGVLQPGDVEVASGVATSFRPVKTTTYGLHVTNPAGRVVRKTLAIAVAGLEGQHHEIQAPSVIQAGIQHVARVELGADARIEWQATGVVFLGPELHPTTPVVAFTAEPGATSFQLKARITGEAGVSGEGQAAVAAKVAAHAPETRELEFKGTVEPLALEAPVIQLDKPFLVAGKDGCEARVTNPQPGTTYTWTLENGQLSGRGGEVAEGEKVTFKPDTVDHVILTCTATHGTTQTITTTAAALVEPPGKPVLQTTSQPRTGERLWAVVQSPRPGERYRWELGEGRGSLTPDPSGANGVRVGYTVTDPGPFTLTCAAENLAGEVSEAGFLHLIVSSATTSSTPFQPPMPLAPPAGPTVTPPLGPGPIPSAPPMGPGPIPSAPPMGPGAIPSAPPMGPGPIPTAPPMGPGPVPTAPPMGPAPVPTAPPMGPVPIPTAPPMGPAPVPTAPRSTSSSPFLSPATPAPLPATRPPQGIALLAGDGLHIKHGYMNGLLGPDVVAWRHLSGLLCHDGHLYFSEGMDHTIRQLDLGPMQVGPFAGRRGAPDEGKVPAMVGLNLPGPMAILPPYCYVVDTGSHTLKRIHSGGPGPLEPFAGLMGVKGAKDGPLDVATFNQPADIVADPRGGFLYVADRGNHRIRMISLLDGAVRTIPGIIQDPQGLALGQDGTLYIASTSQAVIQALVPSHPHDWNATWALRPVAGSAGRKGCQDGTGADGLFNEPMGLALTLDGGSLLVADSGNHLIRQVALATGRVDALAGGPSEAGWLDGPAATARFHEPSRLALDASGFLYVADQQRSALRKLGPDGSVVTLGANTRASAAGAADGPGQDARFRKPLGVAVTRAGFAWVADRDNQALRSVTADGVVTTLAGALGVAGDANGLASEARFEHPAELAIDATGKAWVLEDMPLKLRTISRHGYVTTSGLKPRCIAACPFGPENNAGVVMALPLPYRDGQVFGLTEIRYLVGTEQELVTTMVNPTALALDAAGHVFVLEEDRARQLVTIHKYTPPTLAHRQWRADGKLTLGPGGAIGQQVGIPRIHGMAADSRGQLFLADSANGLVWKVNPGLTDATVMWGRYPFQAPLVPPGGAGHVDPMLSQALYQPHRIAVTPEDDLILTCGHALLRFTAPGTPADPWQAPLPRPAEGARPVPRVAAVHPSKTTALATENAMAARRASITGGSESESEDEDSDFD